MTPLDHGLTRPLRCLANFKSAPVPTSPTSQDRRNALKRLSAAALALLLCIAVPASGFAQTATLPPPPAVKAKSIYVLNADTGQVLYAKNPNLRFRMLSITKLITAYLLTQSFSSDLSAKVTVTKADLAHGSIAGLKPGDVWTLRDLLYAMFLVSGNDAATAVADYVGQAMLRAENRHGNGITRFVQAMRATAISMGARHTSFSDPDGMSRYNLSTAHDIGLIGRVVFRDPQLLPFWQCDRRIVHVEGPHARTVALKSIVEDIGTPGIVGAKTGSYFSKGLYNLVVGWRAPNGQTIVIVVLGAPTHPARYDDVRDIIHALPHDYPSLGRPGTSNDPTPPPFHKECQ